MDPAVRDRNRWYVTDTYNRLGAAGVQSPLLDCDHGSLHLWLPFGCAVRADLLHHFGRSLADNFAEYRFASPPKNLTEAAARECLRALAAPAGAPAKVALLAVGV